MKYSPNYAIILIIEVFLLLHTSVDAEEQTLSLADSNRNHTLADNAHPKRNIEFVDTEISEILHSLSSEFSQDIVFGDSLKGKLVTVKLTNTTLDIALEAILTPHDYTWKEQGSYIYVGPYDDLIHSHIHTTTTTYTPRFCDACSLLEIARFVVSESHGSAICDETSNTLIIKDEVYNLTRVREFLDEIDEKRKENIKVQPVGMRNGAIAPRPSSTLCKNSEY